MLYAGIAIIIAGIMAAISPIIREWYQHRKRKERKEHEGRDAQ